MSSPTGGPQDADEVAEVDVEIMEVGPRPVLSLQPDAARRLARILVVAADVLDRV